MTSLAGLDEPVRRYLEHAVGTGAGLTDRVRLTMRGRVRVGPWLAFDAVQEFAGHEFTWRAEADDRIVATFDVPPERVELRLGIDAAGALRSVSLPRWGDVGCEGHGYIPFGGRIEEERRFGDVVLPSRVVVGWWFGTPWSRPFFDARILRADAPG